MNSRYKQAHDALNSEANHKEFFKESLGQGVGVIYVNEVRPDLVEELREALRRDAVTDSRQIVVMGEPTLSVVIMQLQMQRIKVQADYADLPREEWLSEHGRALANRENELYTTLTVLHGMKSELDQQRLEHFAAQHSKG
ncbi:hypothetical protein N5D77_22860 [Comamonas thiooxydans]|uniref:Uncharacterized protein n=1 Tax=Comamonas thiooxydans TaxID=363952 RepID=A0AA42TUT8_9BURK|nr:hypothetical protein [Comamonas thiooxydans]MDH1337021.1 hypothetical protein [Comamonas thiooxydans]MDH1743182.1 hypothetical protein [Comamonas thiooxydans]MDH1789422.1 hypothetical protein [Comamonas thiooxydans]